MSLIDTTSKRRLQILSNESDRGMLQRSIPGFLVQSMGQGMSTLYCNMREQTTVGELAARNPGFGFLRGRRLRQRVGTRWRRGFRTSRDLSVSAIGKTGYGKSSALNRLAGAELFPTDAVQSCTEAMDSPEFRLDSDDEQWFSLCDLPVTIRHISST